MVLAVHFPGDEEVMKGVELFYNYQTAEAVEILAQARKDFPENPRAHFTWTAARMLDSESHNPVIKSYKIFFLFVDLCKNFYTVPLGKKKVK